MSASNENVISLKVSEIKELIKQRYRNRHIKTRPICIIGHKGIGKTDLVRQASTELSEELGINIRCVTTNLQFKEPPDFLGIPTVRQDKDGNERTYHAVPIDLPGSNEFVVWFFDEANRCNRDNRAGLLTILQDRRIENHHLGQNVLPILAMNPAEADGVSYEVQEFDAALDDRVAKVWLKGDFDEFLKFMVAKYGDDNSVVQWISNQPEVVDFRGKLRTSPRGIDYLADAIIANDGMESPTIFNVIAAEIGMEAAHVFQKFMTDAETIKADEIMNSFSKATKKKLEKLEKQGRNDVLNTLVKNVCVYIANSQNKLSPKELKNLTDYIEFMPSDTKTAFFLELGEQTSDKADTFDCIVDHLLDNSESTEKFLNDHDNKRPK